MLKFKLMKFQRKLSHRDFLLQVFFLRLCPSIGTRLKAGWLQNGMELILVAFEFFLTFILRAPSKGTEGAVVVAECG